MKIKVQLLHKDAVMPKQGREGDACWDLRAVSKKELAPGTFEYGTGIAIQVPEDHVGLIFPRSSVSTTSLVLANSVGVVDPGYTGEVKVRFKDINEHLQRYDIGEKIGQIMVIPRPYLEFEVVMELTKTERGNGGFGSTGK